MRVYIQTKELQAGMATAVRSLSSKPSMRILEGVYIKAENDTLLLRCSDLALQIDCVISASVEDEGETVLPGRLFSEIVRKLDGDTVEMELTNKTINIKCGRARTSLQCLDPKEFPDMAVVAEDCVISLPQAVCRDMIRETAFAVATEETKPVLTGLLFSLSGNILTVVGLDGFRLAMKKYTAKAQYDDSEYIVPGKSIQEIGRTLLDDDEPVELRFSRTHLVINMGHTRIMSRLLDGNYIKYKGLLPVAQTTRVRVNTQELYESVERAILLLREGGNYVVRFNIEESGMQVTANSTIGKIEEELDIHLNGTAMQIAFNARYFSDVLKCIRDEEIFLDMNNNVSPCVVRPIQGDDFYYLILPVRIFA